MAHAKTHGALRLTQKIHKTFEIPILFSSYFFHKQLEYHDIGDHKKDIFQGFHYSAISASQRQKLLLYEVGFSGEISVKFFNFAF